jgi:hypothetical protein
VKNFPLDWDEKKLRDIFEKYGQIKSCVRMTKEKPDGEDSAFSFVCFENLSNPADKEYGPKAAMKAVAELNDKEVAPGVRLYVREALKKAEREVEKRKD